MFPTGFTSLMSHFSFLDDLLCAWPFTNVFIFENFNIHLEDLLTYSGPTDRRCEIYYIVFISNELTQTVNFPTWIPDCESHSPALLDFFLSSEY